MKVGIQGNDNRTVIYRPLNYLDVLSTGHPDLADVDAVYFGGAKFLSRITRQTLVKKKADQTAGVSEALSSRLAAAKAKACRMSSGSNSG